MRESKICCTNDLTELSINLVEMWYAVEIWWFGEPYDCEKIHFTLCNQYSGQATLLVEFNEKDLKNIFSWLWLRFWNYYTDFFRVWSVAKTPHIALRFDTSCNDFDVFSRSRLYEKANRRRQFFTDFSNDYNEIEYAETPIGLLKLGLYIFFSHYICIHSRNRA